MDDLTKLKLLIRTELDDMNSAIGKPWEGKGYIGIDWLPIKRSRLNRIKALVHEHTNSKESS